MEKFRMGSIRLSRVTCTDGPDYVHLVLEDGESRTRFLEIQFGFAALGELLTGIVAPCTFEVRGIQRLRLPES